MAKKSKTETRPMLAGKIDGVPYDVHDAYHTLKRARQIVGDKKLMAAVKKHAGTMAEESRQVAHHAGMLAKMGKISPKAMAKLGKTHKMA